MAEASPGAGATPRIRRRAPGDASALPSTLHPVLRRIYAARGLCSANELALDLKALLPPDALRGIESAVELLDGAIRQRKKIVVVGDYDADGATGCAVAVCGLRALGAAQVDFLVPSRFKQGYGLSPALAAAAKEQGAELLVTVDNGIASLSGVAAAQAAGLQVLVTDHHLAGPELPSADAIVNPNQPGCSFGSKHLAGVGVMFYVLLALRARRRAAGAFADGAGGPNLAELLDLVAAGTVADLVRLDGNNRILVSQGLARIRARRARPGLLALMQVAGRRIEDANAGDLGFAIGPRLNAAGRLDDMRLGIDCLLSASEAEALERAQQLDRLNRERREIEARMRDEAMEMVESLNSSAVGVVLFDQDWHEGVVGLVASRVKDGLHRPTIAFARAQEAGMLKGSARSIGGLHVRDALAAVDARHPGMIPRFGGHAMAAGLSLAESRLDAFAAAFDAVCREWLSAEALEAMLETDGALADGELRLDTALCLERGGPWGQGFPEPLFDGRFDVVQSRLIGERHARYKLRTASGLMLDAVHFGGAEGRREGGGVEAAYRLVVNRYQGVESAELRLEWLGAA